MKRTALCLLAVLVLAMPASALVWEWDCTSDPTISGEWAVNGGDPFNNNIDNGVYLGGQQIRTVAEPFWKAPIVKANIMWKATTDSRWDAHMWMPIDSDYDYDTQSWTQLSPMMVHLTYDSATDTQTLIVQDVYEYWTGEDIATLTGLPNEMLDTELVWDTVADTISVSVNGDLLGTYDYTAFDPGGNGTNQYAAIGGGGAMMLDSIRIEAVPEPATMLLLGGGLLGLVAARRRRK